MHRAPRNYYFRSNPIAIIRYRQHDELFVIIFYVFIPLTARHRSRRTYVHTRLYEITYVIVTFLFCRSIHVYVYIMRISSPLPLGSLIFMILTLCPFVHYRITLLMGFFLNLLFVILFFFFLIDGSFAYTILYNISENLKLSTLKREGINTAFGIHF